MEDINLGAYDLATLIEIWHVDQLLRNIEILRSQRPQFSVEKYVVIHVVSLQNNAVGIDERQVEVECGEHCFGSSRSYS